MRVPSEVNKEVQGEIWILELIWDLAESSNIVRKVVIEQTCILK